MKHIYTLIGIVAVTTVVYAKFEDDLKKGLWLFKTTNASTQDIRFFVPISGTAALVCIKPSPQTVESAGQRCFLDSGTGIKSYEFAPLKIQALETKYAQQMKDPKTFTAFLGNTSITKVDDQGIAVYTITFPAAPTHPLACKKDGASVECLLKLDLKDQPVDDAALYYGALIALYTKQNPTAAAPAQPTPAKG